MAGRCTGVYEEQPLSPRRIREMRARYLEPPAITACTCGQGCGLTFPATAGRRFHPQCPHRPGERDKRGRIRKNRGLLSGPPRKKRCELCEDLPHRRRAPRCPVCHGLYADDCIEPVEGRAGCALGLAY